MYLIKNIYLDYQTGNVVVKNGIEVAMLKEDNKKMLIVTDDYWGKTLINIGCFFDESNLLPTKQNNFYLLPYVSSYDVDDWGDGFKEFSFNISVYQPEKIEGYMVFVKHAKGITTNGKKLYGRYPVEIIVVLKDGEYIEFDGKKAEVISGKLMLHI